MAKITMGSDEFILYIRKQHPLCKKSTQILGSEIGEWMTRKGFYNPEAKKGEDKCKNERISFWETKNNAYHVDKEYLPEKANQYFFDRELLPELYNYLDIIAF